MSSFRNIVILSLHSNCNLLFNLTPEVKTQRDQQKSKRFSQSAHDSEAEGTPSYGYQYDKNLRKRIKTRNIDNITGLPDYREWNVQNYVDFTSREKPEMLKQLSDPENPLKAVDEKEGMEELFQFIKDQKVIAGGENVILVAHNAMGFDIPYMSFRGAHSGADYSIINDDDIDVIDTVQFARDFVVPLMEYAREEMGNQDAPGKGLYYFDKRKGQTKYISSLQRLAKAFNTKGSGSAHTAKDDVVTLIDTFSAMYKFVLEYKDIS